MARYNRLYTYCPENYIVEADFCYKMLDAPTGKWKYSDVAAKVTGLRREIIVCPPRTRFWSECENWGMPA
jgi:hypothetical protein